MPVDVSAVSNLPIFAGLDAESCERVLRESHSSQVAQGKAVFQQGVEVFSIYLLLRGHVRVSRITESGDQVIVRLVSGGGIFGAAHAMGLATHPVSATAVEDSLVLSWPATAWGALSARFPLLAANTLKAIGEKLQEAQNRVVEMSTEHVDQRLARTLLRLADRSGCRTDDGVAINFPLTRRDIAEMTGSTIFTVSRRLSSWEERGWIDGSRQRVILKHPQALRAIVADVRAARG